MKCLSRIILLLTILLLGVLPVLAQGSSPPAEPGINISTFDLLLVVAFVVVGIGVAFLAGRQGRSPDHALVQYLARRQNDEQWMRRQEELYRASTDAVKEGIQFGRDVLNLFAERTPWAVDDALQRYLNDVVKQGPAGEGERVSEIAKKIYDEPDGEDDAKKMLDALSQRE